MDAKRIYDEVYETIPGYGDVNHGGRMQRYVVKELKPKSVLDVGCGKGVFCQYLAKNGILTYGLDVSAPLPKTNNVTWFKHDLKSIPLMTVEWVTAFDVLEHIPEKDLEKVFKEFDRVARKGFIFSICFRDSIYKVQGQSLHPTVKPVQWWKDKLSSLGNVTTLEEYDTYGYYRVDK